MERKKKSANDMKNHPAYEAFMLRIWRTPSSAGKALIELEQVHTGEKKRFSSKEDLDRFLTIYFNDNEN